MFSPLLTSMRALQRWLIELFFRIFKQLFGRRHLLSTKQNGVEIQTYLAIIACLLILIYTGRAPTKRTFEMIRTPESVANVSGDSSETNSHACITEINTNCCHQEV